MFVGTAWNNGSYRMSGAGYGIKLNPRDRDRYFEKPNAFLKLEGKTGDIEVNTDKSSYCQIQRSRYCGTTDRMMADIKAGTPSPMR